MERKGMPQPDCIFVAPARSIVREAVHEVLDEFGDLAYERKGSASPAVLESLGAEAIKSCRLVIVDITEPNPGVMYALGYGDALGKRLILTMDEERGSTALADLAGRLVLLYSQKDLETFKRRLKAMLTRELAGAEEGCPNG